MQSNSKNNGDGEVEIFRNAFRPVVSPSALQISVLGLLADSNLWLGDKAGQMKRSHCLRILIKQAAK